MKEYACIRTRGQRLSLPYRRPVGVGSGARALGRTRGSAGAGSAPTSRRSACHAHGRYSAVGDVGALIWVAEQLDLIGHIDRACGGLGAKGGPSIGELAVAVAIQRACAPGPKRDRGVSRFKPAAGVVFDGVSVQRASFSSRGAAGYRAPIGAGAGGDLEGGGCSVQSVRGRACIRTTNFDTHIATLTPGELARRGHAKSKRRDCA